MCVSAVKDGKRDRAIGNEREREKDRQSDTKRDGEIGR